MKYLILLLIVLVGIWWIRQQRKPKPPSDNSKDPLEMVACVHCGTHVPENDATKGTKGAYCSQAHRETHEG